MKKLYLILALFLIEQSFTSKQDDYITFNLISNRKKKASKLIHVNKKTNTNKTLCEKDFKHKVNKNFTTLLKKLQKTI